MTETPETADLPPSLRFLKMLVKIIHQTSPVVEMSDEQSEELETETASEKEEELIEEKTGINTMTAEDPLTAVAIGTGKYIEYLADDDKKSKNK